MDINWEDYTRIVLRKSLGMLEKNFSPWLFPDLLGRQGPGYHLLLSACSLRSRNPCGPSLKQFHPVQ
jgi:hypothetical protein